MMKLPQPQNGKEKSTVQAPKKNETVIFGLSEFKEKYPENVTTPLVYFDEGMKPVRTIYTDMVDLSKKIIEEDKVITTKLVQEDNYEGLADFVMTRRDSVLVQYNNRVLFLARSLALNFHMKISNILKPMSENGIVDSYSYKENPIEFITNLIYNIFKDLVKSPEFGNTNRTIDYMISYTTTGAVIPMIISEIYDLYDDAIVRFASNYVSYYKTPEHKKEKMQIAEKTHLDILSAILPLFESLNSQIEWLSYMIRDEVRTIYRPMAMEEAAYILNNHLQEIQKQEEVIPGEHDDITIVHF